MFVNVPIGISVWFVGSIVLAETQRRRGRFDLTGALTSTVGMSGIVFGLVEAGSGGWSRPLSLIPLTIGILLSGMFLIVESRAVEPILPLRLLAHTTRASANTARGMIYAGMYGSFYFLSQFLQDVQRYSPLRAGVAFLPMPASVFLASQLTSRVLTQRFTQRAIMMTGAGLAGFGLLLAVGLQTGTGYPQILVTLVLLGSGAGAAFVALTSASLADVAPGDAGAASGLINVSQQVGAALGLAVFVTAFGFTTGHAQLADTPRRGATALLARFDTPIIGGLHTVFELGALFAFGALLLVALGVRTSRGRVEAAEAEGDERDCWQCESPLADAG